ncbi:MAG: cupredoxin domain-containing protein [Halobacterium sp.]
MTSRVPPVAGSLLVLAVAGVLATTALTGATAVADGGRYAHHPTPEGNGTLDVTLVENGSVVNANPDNAPGGCASIQGERRVTIHAGREYAAPGEAFAYDRQRLTAPPCTRIVVTVVNHDDVRHQWMVHGLPTDTYPMGMFTIEVADRGRVTAAFVTPATAGTYRGHCSLPQHAQKGMRLPLVVTGDQTSTQPTTTTSTPTATPGSDADSPGLGLLAATTAALAAAALALRR